MSDPVILVGRRGDGGHRDRLWRYCEQRWQATLGWPVFVGVYDDPGPFCLAHASNRAAALAGGWTVAVYIGADWIAVDPDSVRAAVAEAERRGQLVFAHDRTGVLPEEPTGRLLDNAPLESVLDDAEWHTNTFSGVLAIPRVLWDAVGGFDERFVGWGFDDLAFLDACNALGGGYDRVPGRIVHLYHERIWEQREGTPEHGRNQVLWERYRAVRSNAAAMRGLLSEPGGPLS